MAPRGEIDFLRVVGRDIVNSQDEKVMLRGVCLGNAVWDQEIRRVPDWVLQEADFQRLAGLGVNVVRYALSYKWFENNPEQGLEDLRTRIEWARTNGIYVVLDMHAPPGGQQSEGQGSALWAERSNQERLIALWQAIAERYKDDPIVAGYDILNEPLPPNNQAWQSLAREIITAIREIDNRHIIIVTNTLSTYEEQSSFPCAPFLVDDNNIVYTAHIYDPFPFTHQGAFWIPGGVPQGAHYPDTVVENARYVGGYYSNPVIINDTSWRYLEGNWVDLSAAAPEGNLGQVIFQSTNEGGQVWVRNFYLEAMAPDGTVTALPLRNAGFAEPPISRALLAAQVEGVADKNFYPPYWVLSDAMGRELSDPAAVMWEDAAVRLGGLPYTAVAASILNNLFAVQPGYRYRVSGEVRGEGLRTLTASAGNWNSFAINIYRGEQIRWGREYLMGKIGFYADWASRHGVPLYIGEFGVMTNVPQGEDVVWARDILRLFHEYELHWTMWDLRSWTSVRHYGFSLLTRIANDPNEQVRQPLLDLLRQYT
jgi:endoglucanase